ncbi:hypothetical protein RSAG8_12824, partial [Rhizoctonia solani AG-8 WAC10335]
MEEESRTKSIVVVNTIEGISQAITQMSLEFRTYQNLQDERWTTLQSLLDKIESITIEARDDSLDCAQAPPSPETIKGKAKEEQQPPIPRSSLSMFQLPKSDKQEFCGLDHLPQWQLEHPLPPCPSKQ